MGRITYPPLLPFHLHTHTYPLNCLLHFVPSLEQLDSAYNRSFSSCHITPQSWVLCNNTLIYTILGNGTHGRISTAFTHSPTSSHDHFPQVSTSPNKKGALKDATLPQSCIRQLHFRIESILVLCGFNNVLEIVAILVSRTIKGRSY